MLPTAKLDDTTLMTLPRTRNIAVIGALGGIAALAIAFASERFLDLIPCALCLLQRWPYRIAILVGVLGAVLPRAPARAACWALVALYLAAAVVGATHVGVEQHWWKSPLPECTSPSFAGLSPAERLAKMPDRPSKSCEDADYVIHGLPITFAQLSLLYALGFTGLLTLLLLSTPRRYR